MFRPNCNLSAFDSHDVIKYPNSFFIPSITSFQTFSKSNNWRAYGRNFREDQAIPGCHADQPRRKLAPFFNTYNFMALKIVLDYWSLDSIKNAGSLLLPV